jgi:pimeloyl-ACP methyl ester carboxylesterase
MLEWILTLFFLLIIAIAGIIFLGYFWQWFYYRPTTQDQTFYFRADDGWRLALNHYRATKQTVGLPVILCHGLGANRYIFDIPGAPSLADFLKRHGRDVWVPDLRGSGMSDHPRLMHSDVPYSWGFEDHLLHDVPAIINRVMESTGSPGVHWVGHSMGGLLILAHVASHSAPNLASIIAMGSPTDFSKMDTELFGPLLRLKLLFEKLPISPLPLLGRLIAPLAPWIPASVWGLFHQTNIGPSVARKVIALASTPVSSGKLWLDFGRFLNTGVLGPETGVPYLENLHKSNTSILVIGGSKDLMAPPQAVSALCKRANTGLKADCLIMGKESGCLDDYGHVDLLVGIRAQNEIFPKILDWLDQHDKF